MEDGVVLGTVVASEAHACLKGIRLLLVQPVDRHGAHKGTSIVVADASQAGIGQRVHFVYGREASLALPGAPGPVDAAIVAIVDGSDPAWQVPQ